jgi:twitching motility protein PilT
VFATLHTANAAQSIDRIVDVFPPYQQQQIRIQLASTIEAVVSQQLLPNQRFFARTAAGRMDGQRRAAATATIQRVWPNLEEIGRVPAVEIMIATPAIRNLIREAKTHQIESTLQTGAQYGMQTMDMALADLVRRQLISTEDAIARAIHADELRKLIHA